MKTVLAAAAVLAIFTAGAGAAGPSKEYLQQLERERKEAREAKERACNVAEKRLASRLDDEPTVGDQVDMMTLLFACGGEGGAVRLVLEDR